MIMLLRYNTFCISCVAYEMQYVFSSDIIHHSIEYNLLQSNLQHTTTDGNRHHNGHTINISYGKTPQLPIQRQLETVTK